MVAESIHGTLRAVVIAPALGDLRARQVGVLTGALIVVVIAAWLACWLAVSATRRLLAIAILWVALTLIFEVTLGRVVLDASWEHIASDDDLRRGGRMPLGLRAMALAPLMGARIRGLRAAPACDRGGLRNHQASLPP
jgi:hypothetical protein